MLLKRYSRIFFVSTIIVVISSLNLSAQNPIRIMPLGDSITYGSPVAGGYRYPLYVALTNAGYNVDYVGTQTGNSTAGLGTEINHEGHGGWRITNPSNGLYDYIYGWFEQIEDPHVILLHIGTNDSYGFDPALDDIDNLDKLITRIAECQPSAQIIVTSLMKRNEPNYTYITNYFNPYIPGKVAGQQVLGRNVTFLDMHAYVELTDLADSVHPNATGYQKMADAWFPAITNVIGTNPGPNQPAPIQAHGSLISLINAEISFNKAVSLTSATNTANYSCDGGITITNVTLSGDQRTVTIYTTLMDIDTTYTVTMTNITDETTPTPLTIPAGSQVQFTSITSGPAALSAEENYNYVNVAITFSKAVSTVTALNTANYSIPGLTVTDATLSSDHKTVTLTTTTQTPGTTYTITMNNIADETIPTPLTIPANSQLTFMPLTQRGYYNHIEESSSYQLVYTKNLPTYANYRDNDVLYETDNSANFDKGCFSRIAYYMELQRNGEDLHYLWVSMNAFETDAGKIGFPTLACGGLYQQIVTNLNVYCNVAGVTTGTGLPGNIEFWPYNYSTANAIGIPDASGSTFDFGDIISTGGNHGSMQIHNYGAQETLMAINAWGGGGKLAIGIGTDPFTGRDRYNPDWTFSDNSDTYSIKMLQVLVQFDNSGDTTAPQALSAKVPAMGNAVIVSFDELIASGSVIPGNFSISGGVQIYSAVLQEDRRSVLLTTSPLTGSQLTLTINNIRDAAATPIAPGTTLQVMPEFVPEEIITNVGTNSGELAHGYELIYSFDLPVYSTFGDSIDDSSFNQSDMGREFDRIAYYLELTPANGTPQYVWTSMDAFSDDLKKISVPTLASGAIYQQSVTNLDVKSNVSSITEGTGMAGNIEFWPYDYYQSNIVNVAGASETAFDYGDGMRTTGTHGSMQVHSTDFGQCLLNMNNWGSNGRTMALGIGNRPGSSDIDWTHADNAHYYVHRRLHVLVRPLPVTPPAIPAEVSAHVSGAENYYHLYTINIPTNPDFFTPAIAASYYTVDNRSGLSNNNLSRIAYYLELVTGGTATNYIWTAMDAFTDDVTKIGVPVLGTYFRQYVTGLDIQSNVGGIISGNGINTGNIEFWPSNYGGSNGYNIPGATSSFDFGDSGGSATCTTANNYGCMQVHNYGAAQTLFAFNCFNDGSTACIGIGNRPTGEPDWTFASNSGSYSSRRLLVFVIPGGDGDHTPPSLVKAQASSSLNKVIISFSEEMADSAADATKYTIDNGVSVLSASLHPNKTDVELTTTAMTPGQSYTLNAGAARDRSANANPLLPTQSSATFTAPEAVVLPEFFAGIPEANDYDLIYLLKVTDTTSYASGCDYTIDESRFSHTESLNRIAYCMELVSGGVTNWAWASMDAFSKDLYLMGVPTGEKDTRWQQTVDNMNVYASPNAAVTTGVGIATGNIEFWPNNYGTANAIGIPGASGSTYDFGDDYDENIPIGHGSMQIHNYGAGHTIMSMISFGSNGRHPGLGIGSKPGTGNDPDWTFTYNGSTYSTKNIYVLAGFGESTGSPLNIWSHPVSQTAYLKHRVALSVYAPEAISYQWRKNGVDIPNANSSILEFPSCEFTDAGTYSVVVISADDKYAVSESAALNVFAIGTTLILR